MSRTPPLHEVIRRALEEEILSGARQPGSRLPSETELAAQWDCARMTAGRALNALAQAGMVERRRRAGTLVARRRIQETVLEIHDIAAEIRARGRVYGFRRLERRAQPSDPAEAERLAVEDGAPVLAILGVHLADGVPHALEDRLINLSVAPDAAAQAFETAPPGGWLLDHVPWTEAEHEIYAAAADPATARHLAMPRAAPCLVMERRTWLAGACVTHARLAFPADQRRFTARLRHPPRA
jgi:GntR family histidine utilization transcriptional repressor